LIFVTIHINFALFAGPETKTISPESGKNTQ